MMPTNALEWLGLILFVLTTPVFFWFLLHELKKRGIRNPKDHHA